MPPSLEFEFIPRRESLTPMVAPSFARPMLSSRTHQLEAMASADSFSRPHIHTQDEDYDDDDEEDDAYRAQINLIEEALEGGEDVGAEALRRDRRRSSTLASALSDASQPRELEQEDEAELNELRVKATNRTARQRRGSGLRLPEGVTRGLAAAASKARASIGSLGDQPKPARAQDAAGASRRRPSDSPLQRVSIASDASHRTAETPLAMEDESWPGDTTTQARRPAERRSQVELMAQVDEILQDKELEEEPAVGQQPQSPSLKTPPPEAGGNAAETGTSPVDDAELDVYDTLLDTLLEPAAEELKPRVTIAEEEGAAAKAPEKMAATSQSGASSRRSSPPPPGATNDSIKLTGIAARAAAAAAAAWGKSEPQKPAGKINTESQGGGEAGSDGKASWVSQSGAPTAAPGDPGAPSSKGGAGKKRKTLVRRKPTKGPHHSPEGDLAERAARAELEDNGVEVAVESGEESTDRNPPRGKRGERFRRRAEQQAVGTVHRESKRVKAEATATTTKKKLLLDPETGEDLSRYQRAWYCVLDAQHGRSKHGLSSISEQPQWQRRAFALSASTFFGWLFRAATVAHVSAVYYEDKFLLQGALTATATLLIYYLDVGLKLCYMGVRSFFSKTWNVYMILYLALFTIDFVLLSSGQLQPFRVLRPWVILCREYEMRRLYQALVNIVPTLAGLMLVILVFLLFFAAVGVHTFADSYTRTCPLDDEADFQASFDHVPIAMVRMFSLGGYSMQGGGTMRWEKGEDLLVLFICHMLTAYH